MLMNCTAKAYEINKSRMVRLAEYSRDCLMELRAETGIEYDHRARGTLQMLRNSKAIGRNRRRHGASGPFRRAL